MRHGSYVVTCWRDGSDWAVEVPDLGVEARTSRFSRVEKVARDLVAANAHEDPATCRVVVDVVARRTLTELLAAAAAVRENPDEMSVEAVTMRRSLAQRLVLEGFDETDVAALLGLSYARALQLVVERPSSTLREAAEARTSTRVGTFAVDAPDAPDATTTATCGTGDGEGGTKQHTTYRHEAFLYKGEQEFLDGLAPFVREGIAWGQPVMVALVPARLELLRAAIGADAEHVYWVDMTQLGGNPGRIIPAWRQFIDEHDVATPLRGVGEPVWAGRRAAEIDECQLHESLLNLAVEPDTPLWLRCPYDVQALSEELVEESLRSHPALVRDGDYLGSTMYGGAAHAATLFARDLPEPRGDPEEWHYHHRQPGGGLQPQPGVAEMRHVVQQRAAAEGLAPARRADLALAVTEAANNSIRHGGGCGTLRIWREEDALVCEVRDSGRITDPMVGRHKPLPGEHRGRGLWLVHQLSDLAQIRSSSRGSTIRMTTWL